MQFFKKNIKPIVSQEFFSGMNIFQKLNNSTFAIFHNNIKKMEIPTEDFKLPIITIIGNESSGKSSLISNILKCDIFPINKNRCTKCPVKIQLVNDENEYYLVSFKGNCYSIESKEQILEKVISIMNGIDDIIEDELHVLFKNPNVITSTYYDLPGIIEYPDNLRQKSKAIVNKYIQQDNTLIICVVPASTPRLTSNQALGMVIDSKKTKDCIIALSMIDLLHDDDIEIFINRILMKSDEISPINIYNVIGLSNNNKIDEKKWFADNILKYIDDAKIKKQIISKITLDNLLKSVDDMYDNFIKLNWKDKAISTANSKIEKLKDDYKLLGDENIKIVDLYGYIKNKISFDNILLNCYLKIENQNKHYYLDNNYLECDKDIEELKDAYQNSKKIIKEHIISSLDNLYSNNNYQLSRYSDLKRFLIDSYNNIIDTELIYLDEWFNKSIDFFKYDLVTNAGINNIKLKININIKRYILKKLNEFQVNDERLLIENDEWIEKRNKITAEMNKYEDCKTNIAKL